MATINANQKITPFLWFNGNLEEAVRFYTSVFKNSKVHSINHLPGESAGTTGKAFTATFQLEDLQFMALDGGPMFNFSPATSFFVNCSTQQEVDELWEKLSADGGKTNQCGWLDDKFGITWQIVPVILGQLLYDKDRTKANRVMQAMLKMTRLDIALLQQAYDQE